MTRCAGALLAGGRSRRMGTDKALLPWAGGVLWEYQWGKLRALGAEPLLLSCREEQVISPGAEGRRVYDECPDCGPLGGVAACLRAADAPLLVVLGVDLPLLPVEVFGELLAASRPGCGAVMERGGFYEPLAAVYPLELLPVAEAMLREGTLAMQEFIRRGVAAGRMQVLPVPAEGARWFTNWNSPEDVGAGTEK